jgi:hypothetical protein
MKIFGKKWLGGQRKTMALKKPEDEARRTAKRQKNCWRINTISWKNALNLGKKWWFFFFVMDRRLTFGQFSLCHQSLEGKWILFREYSEYHIINTTKKSSLS